MSTRQSTTREKIKTIAIIGGGFSGALTAYHLVQQQTSARVIVIDPRPELGLGLAYSTPSLQHLLNVPADRISALPSEPQHFLSWLRANHDPEATGSTFAPRAVFGRYVRSLLAATRGIEQIQAEVVDYADHNPGAMLTLSDGNSIRADLVVLATGNFDPAALRGVSEQALEAGVYAHNAWDPATYGSLAVDAPVTLIGTGLTAVDVLLRLRESGHRGTVTAISRHGIFPNRHTPYMRAIHCALPVSTPSTCVAYLRAVRKAIDAGTEWRAAIDSLRSTTNDLWLALPVREQARFRRHLQRRWDVVRHRMAPPVADIIDGERAAGTLLIREGHLESVEELDGHAMVTIRTGDEIRTFKTSRVMNCTGPNMDYRRVESALLASLFAKGLAVVGALGGGLSSSRCGALIGSDGKTSETLFNVGPGRMGTLLESIAIPELRQQAVELAAILAGRVQKRALEITPPSTQYLHPEEKVLRAASA